MLRQFRREDRAEKLRLNNIPARLANATKL